MCMLLEKIMDIEKSCFNPHPFKFSSLEKGEKERR